ncbi:2,3-bisphosphoglycerate-dependent phosphoglycerate mutase [Paenibacillus auburnensis]|uniref:2,3-bisphosphoglycerate-dependent phosphoglycerate mutase n=1 Tax=Paenibacillus auburnensis TaxID=2905649 RepID=A0ABN8H0Q0_9BACL|nr:histidine phosphatase family protein [Paenibacillus auburnensis]CAH1217554.1 2,3-bisphosphoglycerate-dependent phosphoglycerate mutase [Paenibacillus auburnensis]
MENTGHEQTPNPSRQQRQIELELVLLRHGHTKWNIERRYLGSTDLPLLPEERTKLAALREQPELAGRFWRVYCSDLLRCRETLHSIVPTLEGAAIYDSRLRELSFGEWEGNTYEQLKYNPKYRSWIDDPAAITPPGGEPWEAFAARLEHFMNGLVHEAEAEQMKENRCFTQRENIEGAIAGADSDADTNTDAVEPSKLCRQEPMKLRVLIVTHGGVIRQWLAKAESGTTFYTASAPPPGAVAVLHLLWQEDGGWALSTTGGVNLSG